jgi:uncharacterized protein YecT (DUF1311 family)
LFGERWSLHRLCWYLLGRTTFYSGGFKEIRKALVESKKAWTQQRDALCPVFDKIEPGFLPGDANYCRMQTTANRALLLRKLGDAVNEH